MFPFNRFAKSINWKQIRTSGPFQQPAPSCCPSPKKTFHELYKCTSYVHADTYTVYVYIIYIYYWNISLPPSGWFMNWLTVSTLIIYMKWVTCFSQSRSWLHNMVLSGYCCYLLSVKFTTCLGNCSAITRRTKRLNSLSSGVAQAMLSGLGCQDSCKCWAEYPDPGWISA